MRAKQQRRYYIMNYTFPANETIEIEFKSDIKKLNDSDLIDAVVAFANTSGGTIYLGIEDDGTYTEQGKIRAEKIKEIKEKHKKKIEKAKKRRKIRKRKAQIKF